MAGEKKRTILCVDDEADITQSLFDTFMDYYNVKTANSGAEALKIFGEEEISLVISDQRMPEMEGTELLARIHKIKPICKKILLTGYADINAAIEAINSGAVDKYFSKPWEDDQLVKSVGDLVEELGMDEFFEKAIGEAKGMREEVEKAKSAAVPIEKFLDSYLNGVCVVGGNDKIEYMNKKGLALIKCKDSEEVKGKDVKDVFSINELNKQKLVEKYVKKDASPGSLEVKLCDGSSVGMQASVAFASDDSGINICGIVFSK
jgi:CheY-like chemotaxis protein